jgi:predicted nucleic acid-binding protein
MEPVLVDSDILIEVSRGANPDIVARWIDLSNSDNAVLYSPVSIAELLAGARPKKGARPKEYEALRNLFLALTCAPIDEAVGIRPGFIFASTGGAMPWKWRMPSSLRVRWPIAPSCGLETANITQ